MLLNQSDQQPAQAAILADDMMIQEIGSEQKTSGTASTAKAIAGIEQNGSDLDIDGQAVKINLDSGRDNQR